MRLSGIWEPATVVWYRQQEWSLGTGLSGSPGWCRDDVLLLSYYQVNVL